MAVTPLLTQADLELAVGGPLRLAQQCCDDGSGVASSAIVTSIIARTSDHAAGILLSAFSIAQIVQLAATDEALKGALRDLGAGYVGKRKVEFMDPNSGIYPYERQMRDAIALLKDFRSASQRLAGEESTGNQNRTIGVRTQRLPGPRIFATSPAGVADSPAGGRWWPPFGTGGF